MAKIKLRRDTAANWSSANPILALGEPGYDTTNNKIKVGNGTTAWNSLSYLTDESGGGAGIGSLKISGSTIGTVDESDPEGWGDYDLVLNPGGESAASIYIPSVGNQGEGYPIQISNTQDPTSAIQLFGRGGVQVATNTGEGQKVFEFRDDGNLTLPNGGIIRADEGNVEIGNITNFNVEAGGVVNIYTSTESETPHQWQFGDDGNLNLPEGGDILDSEGNSVLGGGTVSVGNGDDPSVQQVSEILFNGTVTEIGPNVVSVDIDPTIPNTKRGFINLVGDRPNNDSTIGFSTVAVWGDYAYVLGSDFYFTSSTDKTKVYKFDLRTGEQVWVKQIRSSRGAEFDLTIGSGTVTLDLISDSGTGYKVGEEIVIRGGDIGGSNPENDVTIIVDAIDGSGGVNTASIKPGYDVTGLTGTYTNITIQRDDIEGDTCAIAYSPIINKVLAVSEYWTNYGNNEDSNWNWANLYVIDPATGAIDSTVTLSDEGDIYPNSIDVTSVNGDAAIAGEKYNEYREFGTLTLLAGYNGYFDILKSNLDPEHYPGDPYSNYGDFWITGTGITNQENVDNVNEYANVATTVRQGSGATFSVTVAIPGDPYATASQFAFGTNYRVGHKVKLSGADLGGTTPENDVTITVTSVDGDGGITGVSFEGTSNVGALPGTIYNGISGTNYNVGSGYTAFIYVDATTGAYNYGGSNNPGSNYVAGDVITITGTTFANGATPANDATIIVGTVDGSGAVNSIQGGTVSGTGQTNALRIRVDGVDFTAPGAEWMMRQNLGGEAFVWTANWSNAIGGASGDRFYDVSWNSDATAIYAVGVGRYEVNYDQALVVKFNAVTGAVIWSKDIKFSEATTENRTARAVCMIPGSSDIMVAGAWYNNSSGYDEIILTRISSEGAAVWQKTYLMGEGESGFGFDYEISIKALDSTNVLVSFEQNTNNSQGLAYLKVNATTGLVVLHRVLSSPGNGNYNAHDTATPTFADIYTEGSDDYVIMAGRTYVPTDDSRNALLIKLPVDGLKNLEISEKLSLGEHLLTRHDVVVTTVTPAFDSFTPDEHLNTITNLENARNYSTIAPDGELGVWTYTVTDDTAGFLEFGDGSKQSFATNVIPQIPAANDYYLTEQDSGKHIFFEQENGTVYIPHRDDRYFPVGFTFTIVNTSGSDCWVETMSGASSRGRLKLAGRNIDTPYIGIPDSGSGSMVTFLKVKDGYTMDNSDGLGDYPDVWMVSGPGDVYNAD